MSDRLRVAKGLLFTVDPDGTTWVWQPRRRERTKLDPELLQLLLRFGDGHTAEQAAEAAGIEYDGSVADATRFLATAELVIAADPPAVAVPNPVQLARRRVADLVDRDSFVERSGEPIVTGTGRVDGREVAIAAWEPRATAGIEHVLALQADVLERPRPIVYLLDVFSIGRRPEDFLGPHAVGRVYANQARLSGLAPQIAIVYGPLWRPSALLPVGCDIVIFVGDAATVSIGDSELVRELTGADLTPEELGGAKLHAEVTGFAHFVVGTHHEAVALVRRYLALMPTSARDPLPARAGGEPPPMSPAELDAIVPNDAEAGFAIGGLVTAFADEGSCLEPRARWAPELSTTFARIGGMPIGIVANCSLHKAGMITRNAADKAARFIATCNAYGLPVLFLVDVLGLAIGRAAEREGIEQAAGRVFSALANMTVPKLTLVVRRAHTAGFFAMGGPAFDADLFFALPTASIAIVSERSAVGSVAALERVSDLDTRDSLRAYIEAQRRPPAEVAPLVVKASEARGVITEFLTAYRPKPRPRQFIPP